MTTALIFGKWHPVGAMLACLFFGLAEAVAIRMQGTVNIPNQFIQMIPYILTMVVLAGLVGRADLVLFPVDCVSHQAMGMAKRLCRQLDKPFVPLRSSGLSSFLAGLAAVDAPAAA